MPRWCAGASTCPPTGRCRVGARARPRAGIPPPAGDLRRARGGRLAHDPDHRRRGAGSVGGLALYLLLLVVAFGRLGRAAGRSPREPRSSRPSPGCGGAHVPVRRIPGDPLVRELLAVRDGPGRAARHGTAGRPPAAVPSPLRRGPDVGLPQAAGAHRRRLPARRGLRQGAGAGLAAAHLHARRSRARTMVRPSCCSPECFWSRWCCAPAWTRRSCASTTTTRTSSGASGSRATATAYVLIVSSLVAIIAAAFAGPLSQVVLGYRDTTIMLITIFGLWASQHRARQRPAARRRARRHLSQGVLRQCRLDDRADGLAGGVRARRGERAAGRQLPRLGDRAGRPVVGAAPSHRSAPRARPPARDAALRRPHRAGRGVGVRAQRSGPLLHLPRRQRGQGRPVLARGPAGHGRRAAHARPALRVAAARHPSPTRTRRAGCTHSSRPTTCCWPGWSSPAQRCWDVGC